MWGAASTVPIRTKICVVRSLPDIIMCANFQVEIFGGYDFTGGRISHFPIVFRMGLTTVQCYCTACDVCLYVCISGQKSLDLPGQIDWNRELNTDILDLVVVEFEYIS